MDPEEDIIVDELALDEGELVEEAIVPGPLDFLMEIAQTQGDITALFSEEELTALGADVVADYQRDLGSRSAWQEKVERALDQAAQEGGAKKDSPWPGASNVQYPLLTTASLQFAARAYPALVKNDEALQIKVFGVEPKGPPAQLMAMLSQPPQSQEQAMAMQQAQAQAEPMMKAVEYYGRKVARGQRVGDYLNYVLFFEEDWEQDTDAMLHQLPIVGCGFRKRWVDPDTRKSKSAYVPALKLVVPQDAKSLKDSPRATEVMDVYPYQIKTRMASGLYRQVDITYGDEDVQRERCVLEQHRMHDLDGDGIEEPYIVTVDKDSAQVLRLEKAFEAEDVTIKDEAVIGFDRWMPYTKYSFIPDPKGRFYDIGFAHLLEQITAVINTMINQMIDAGTAQIAGGGFIAGGLRLQGAGQTNKLTWRPGEYKVVNAPPGQVQSSVYERTFPNVSPVSFQILDMMLTAAQQITSTSDVITGEAPKNAPAATTLALIEQSMQVYSSIYKRIFRAEREEFRMMYDCIGRWGSMEDYYELLDDPQANFEEDFAPEGRDIMPVSDPSSSTKMQKAAKAQFLLGLLGNPSVNSQEILLRALTDMEFDNPEAIIAPPPQPQQPNPKDIAGAQKDEAQAQNYAAEARATNLETDAKSAFLGGLRSMASPSNDPMGFPIAEQGGPGAVPGMGPGIVGGGAG